MRAKKLLALSLLVAGCSTAPPATRNDDAVKTGSETANDATQAAKQAEAKGDTGLLVASSSDGPVTEAAPVVQEAPDTAPATEIEIEIRAGEPTFQGEPLPTDAMPTMFASAAKSDPETRVVITADRSTDAALVADISGKAATAGIEHIKVDWRPATDPTAPEAEGEKIVAPPKTDARPPEETKAKPAEKDAPEQK